MSNSAKLAGCFSIIFLMFGCMAETSEPSIQSDQLTEASLDNDFYTYPLENMRMDPGTLSMVATLRATTAKYHRIEVAMEDGYFQGTPCVSSPNGGMGYHYIRPDNPEFNPEEENSIPFDGTFDPTMPEAILYEMDKNGKMKLVGIEFIIDAEAWDAENEMPPYFGMQEFDEPDEVHNPLPFRNYQIHVWAWKHNPSGIFTPFNPNVKCE